MLGAFMRKFGILIIILLSLTSSPNCLAISQYSSTLTKIEKSLFGTDYGSQTDEQRLKRIEDTVYGSTSSQSVPVRIDKLSKDLSADQIGNEIKPKSDTFASESDSIKEDMPKADSSVNYPAVDNLEKNVFHKVFKSTDINQRLANLEQKVFQKIYHDDLNSRVDRLKTAVAPEQLAQNQDDEVDSDSDSDDYNYNPKKYNQNFSSPGQLGSQYQDENNPFNGDDSYLSSGQPSGYGASVPQNLGEDDLSSPDAYQQGGLDVTVQLGRLEKKILKRTYPNDVVANRILRLELKEFNSSFTEDDQETRLNRIASAYQAKKSASKYDGNKFSQHMATAMQIGAILLMILAAVL